MTTETDNTIAATEVWRAIGRLESDTATLKDGQTEIKTDLKDGYAELKNGQAELKADLHLLDQRVGRLESDTATLKDGQTELKNGQTELKADLHLLDQRVVRLESDTATLKDGQREIKTDLQAVSREVNRRIDRLTYAIIAIGGALLVTMLASNFIGD